MLMLSRFGLSISSSGDSFTGLPSSWYAEGLQPVNSGLLQAWAPGQGIWGAQWSIVAPNR